MTRRDDHKPSHNDVPHATSPSAVRGPVPSTAAESHGERSRSARPRVAAHPSGAHPETHQGVGTGELPETYGVDEVEILCKDPWWYFAYWEVTPEGLKAAREQLGPSGAEARLVLRVFAIGPGNHGGHGSHGGAAGGAHGSRTRDGREIRDVPVQTHHGRRYLEAPRSNALLRVAIGLLSPEGYFAPIAHSSLVRVPPQQPSSDTAVEWLHVLPARGDGTQHERISMAAPPVPHTERALPWQTGSERVAAEAVLTVPGPTSAGGASEIPAAEHSGSSFRDAR